MKIRTQKRQERVKRVTASTTFCYPDTEMRGRDFFANEATFFEYPLSSESNVEHLSDAWRGRVFSLCIHGINFFFHPRRHHPGKFVTNFLRVSVEPGRQVSSLSATKNLWRVNVRRIVLGRRYQFLSNEKFSTMNVRMARGNERMLYTDIARRGWLRFRMRGAPHSCRMIYA